MRATAFATVLSAALATAASDAPRILANPTDVKFTANLPEKPFFHVSNLDGNVQGYIEASAGEGGAGVKFKVKFENLPKEGGPFIYHIHVKPVSEGNCTATGAHLDPENRGEDPPCDNSKPASCQVGDLSGKYGKITQDPFTAEYTDPFSSLQEGTPAYLGNRSFVLHFANKTRITCANFQASRIGSNQTSPGSPTGTQGNPFPSRPGFISAGSLAAVSPWVLGGMALVATAL